MHLWNFHFPKKKVIAMKNNLLKILVTVSIVLIMVKFMPSFGPLLLYFYLPLGLIIYALYKFSYTKIFNTITDKIKNKNESIIDNINSYIEKKLKNRISSNLLSFIKITLTMPIYTLPINIIMLIVFIIQDFSILYIILAMLLIAFIHIFILFGFALSIGKTISFLINFVLTFINPLIFWVDLSLVEMRKVSDFIGSAITIVGLILLIISYFKKDYIQNK